MPTTRRTRNGTRLFPPTGRRASGQAMIEFVVAILLVVVILAGLIQFVELAGIKGVLLAEIRRETGERALGRRIFLGTTPTYILDWEAGSDEIRHTSDDTYTRGIAGDTLQAAVIDRSALQASAWSYLDGARNSAIPDLHASTLPMGALGFVHAELREEVTLLPAMRDWLIGKESITVGTELWFPRLRLEGFD
jgi:hypothetical protein